MNDVTYCVKDNIIVLPSLNGVGFHGVVLSLSSFCKDWFVGKPSTSTARGKLCKFA